MLFRANTLSLFPEREIRAHAKRKGHIKQHGNPLSWEFFYFHVKQRTLYPAIPSPQTTTQRPQRANRHHDHRRRRPSENQRQRLSRPFRHATLSFTFPPGRESLPVRRFHM